MYFVLKHLHLTLIAGAVLLFMVRFYWVQGGSDRAYSAPVLKVSGLLNGLVVLSGVLLCMVLDLNPFNNGTPWLSEKLMGILVLVFLAAMALRLAKSNLVRWCSFLGALGWLYFIAKLALLKQASLFG
ncbi:SirB2 family protein [Aeromonas enteropelogenes]|uniref:SirB2 family protein n=1 Tax=Aeromonas enteropelogenes TaxID=29489 RepID=UPI000F52250D|nr:SirB2 family protein [Aeromonas enteropelogenes]RQM63351.1 invasion protein [Aeromonas enteropelogenes]